MATSNLIIDNTCLKEDKNTGKKKIYRILFNKTYTVKENEHGN